MVNVLKMTVDRNSENRNNKSNLLHKYLKRSEGFFLGGSEYPLSEAEEILWRSNKPRKAA